MTIRNSITTTNNNGTPDFLYPTTTGLANYVPPPSTAPVEEEINLLISTETSTTDPESSAEQNSTVVVPSGNVLVDHTDEQGNNYQFSTISTQAPIVSPDPSPTRTHYTDSRGQLRPVKPHKAHLPDSVLEFKERRQFRTAASAWTGVGVGLIAAGPFGAVVGGLAAYGISKSVGKKRERNMLKRYEASGHRNAEVASVGTGIMA